ncbi:MAG: hypothetical protein A2162_02880 [Deltaproteobacteria bacterium RBG_13_52_11b]|nr:MAG: hypothetical protein A2162_02880 [Deltaproteobacteria bacterium RBG_13_52_11b]
MLNQVQHAIFYENAAECPVLSIRPDHGWTGMNAAVFEFDRQDILVLHSIFAEAGKPRLSVKPRLVGGELHYSPDYDTASQGRGKSGGP